MLFPGRTRRFRVWALITAISALGITTASAKHPARQNGSSEQVSEVVATLATGRVTIVGCQDGLIVAGVGNSFEPKSLPPLLVPLATGDVVVVLGADDWLQPPPAGRTLLRLDRELPTLAHGMPASAPSLKGRTNISNLDRLGLAVLDPLRAAARDLHAQLHLPADLPLAELVIVGQDARGQLEVWDVSYWIRQTFWQENFWATEVERPRFMQLYPTKQNRSGVVEVSYPPGDTSPGLLDWLSHPAGPFAKTLQINPRLVVAQMQLARGKAQKIKLAQLVPLVKTALETMTPSAVVKALATVDEKNGFVWVIRPLVSKPPVKKRPSGAPSLENPPSLGNPPSS